MIDHDLLVRRSHELAPLSPTIVRLAEIVSDGNVDMAEIVKTLAMDPALAGAVLRQANSAKFGGRAEIASVRDAVVRLGPGVVLGLATREGVRRTVDRSLPGFGFSEGMFWRHSCAASLAVEALRKVVRTALPAAASAAALLHDIGKLAMAQFLAPHRLAALGKARTVGGCSRIEAEREILGVDHAEVGGLIAQHWRLPEAIRIGIAFHHDPGGVEHAIADVVHVAAWIADLACPAADGDPAALLDPAVAARLALSSSSLEAVLLNVLGALDSSPSS